MNTIKRILGYLWLILAPVIMIFMFTQAYAKVSAAAEGIMKTNTLLQWSIILIIFLPVSAGLAIFGYYAIKGEYDHLPESSNEL